MVRRFTLALLLTLLSLAAVFPPLAGAQLEPVNVPWPQLLPPAPGSGGPQPAATASCHTATLRCVDGVIRRMDAAWQPRGAAWARHVGEVVTLRHTGWLDAIRTTPRHLFVPRFYRQDNGGTWRSVESGDPDWIDSV